MNTLSKKNQMTMSHTTRPIDHVNTVVKIIILNLYCNKLDNKDKVG